MYEEQEYSVPERRELDLRTTVRTWYMYELSGAIFDGVTIEAIAIEDE